MADSQRPAPTGAMIAFFLPAVVASQLALPGGEPAGELHITLVFLGEAAEIADKREAIERVVKQWASEHEAIQVSTEGLARFTADDGKPEPLVALLDSRLLAEWRRELVRHVVEDAGYGALPEQHGFTPHITLAYLDPGAPSPLENIEPIDVAFDTLALAWAGERAEFPLLTPAPEPSVSTEASTEASMAHAQETIRREGDKWVLYSHDGSKRFGEFDTEDEAKARERDIQYFKHGQGGRTVECALGDTVREAHSVTIRVLEAAPAPEAAEGYEWDVTLIGPETPDDLVVIDGREYVKSDNNKYYACDMLAQAAGMFAEMVSFDNHLTQRQFDETQGMRSAKNEWVATVKDPRWDAQERKLRARYVVVDDQVARKLFNAYQRNALGKTGLSIDTQIEGRRAVIEGRPVLLVEGITAVNSVDLVPKPAAGGGFDRLVAADTTQWEAHMAQNDSTQNSAEALAANNGAPAPVQVQAQAAPPPAQEAVGCPKCGAQVQEGMKFCPACGAPLGQPAQAAQAQAAPAREAARASEAVVDQAARTQLRALECKLLLRDRLDGAKLSDAQRAVVAATFEGRVFEAQDLDRVITLAKAADAAVDVTGRPQGAGATRSAARVTQDQADKFNAAFLSIVVGRQALRSIEASQAHYVQEKARAIEAFAAWQKGRDDYRGLHLSQLIRDLCGGDPRYDERAYEALTSSNLASLTKSALNMMIAAEYSTRPLWWTEVVAEQEVETLDDPTLVRTFGTGTLASVPEATAYGDLSFDDEEETAHYDKRGGIIKVSIEAMMKDKLGKIREIPRKITDSFVKTQSRLVAAVGTLDSSRGPTLSDSGRLFNSTAVGTGGGHANLRTAAFSYTEWPNVRLAMRSQTDEPLGAGDRLTEMEPKFVLGPIDLEPTADIVFGSQYVPGSGNNDVNPYYQKAKFVPVPVWTDTNDWMAVADPKVFPAIWMIYLAGHRVPELFSAGAEAAGLMFTHDVMAWKIRQWLYQKSSSEACAPVGDWRPLHKSNV